MIFKISILKILNLQVVEFYRNNDMKILYKCFEKLKQMIKKIIINILNLSCYL